MKNYSLAVLTLLFMVFASAAAPGPDLEKFFSIPSVQDLPLKTEILSESVKDGVKTTELYLNGAPFNGIPTKLYAFYSVPEKAGKYPAVLQLHGSGLQTLSPQAGIFYAKNGFACISIDWAPPSEKRKGKQSVFESEGRMTKFGPGFQPLNPEKDYLRNGIMFSRRALDFLRSRPEIDRNKLMLSAMSAGAWHALLLLGLEPELKAAAVKYGAMSGIDWGFFSGVFGPLKMVKQKGYKEMWLSYFDAAGMIPKYKADILLLSGTDDIFYAMPVVLETFRRIPSPKKLLMRPNDNHQLVGNEEIPLAYFKSVLKETAEWPEVSIKFKTDGTKIHFDITPDSKMAIRKISIVSKTAPRGYFDWRKHWKTVDAVQRDGKWTAGLEVPEKDMQTVAYASLEDSAGRLVCSDTVEIPAFPKWRGRQGYQALDDGNFFFNPSFEFGNRDFNLRGKPVIDTSGKESHTGKSALRLVGGKSRLTTWALPFAPGKKFTLKLWAKSKTPGAKVSVSIRWAVSHDKNKFTGKNFDLTDQYRQYSLDATIPEDAKNGYLTINPQNSAEIWIDDLYYHFN